MLFLKQLRAHGFKSFAEPITLDFNHNMIGIVGPNGSGKSNITEAIRWALGEQSTKSLRGSSLDDIVFAGNPNHDPIDFAKVTLVFDNSQHIFKNMNNSLVEITRHFNKKTRESAFFVNEKPVKLREIQELALDTGLTRSSIAIISQGMVTQFAEAKPENRRDIFDEAIGMSKYKKRKREAQQKLTKAQENHNRLYDITHEIGGRLASLKKQAAKAQLYFDKTEALKQYELSILNLDVHEFNHQLALSSQDLVAKNIETEQLNHDLENLQVELKLILSQSSETEAELVDLNQKFQDILNNLTAKLLQQKEFESREKTNIDDAKLDDFKIKDLKRRYNNTLLEKEIKKQKTIEMQEVLEIAKNHFAFFENEYLQKKNEVDILSRTLFQINFDYHQAKVNQNNNRSVYNQALKSIIANKKHLIGIIGPLLELIELEEKYQIALSVGAGQNLFSVVAQNTEATKLAIDFLKQNQTGRVTFLPLDNLAPTQITGSIRDFIIQQPGFIGFANELIKIKLEYRQAADFVLASLIVTKDYQSALKLSKATNQRFNIVTLSGEKFLTRGAIVGGTSRNQNFFSNLENENKSLEIQEQKIKNLEVKDKKINQELTELKQKRETAFEKLIMLQNQQEQINNQQYQIDKDLKFINDEYQLLTGKTLDLKIEKIDNANPLAKINQKIHQLNNQRDQVQSEINRLNLVKSKNSSRQEKIHQSIQKIQNRLFPLQKEIGKLEGKVFNLESKIGNYAEVLMKKYQLTIENVLNSPRVELANEIEARALIETLQEEINQLGNVNMEALNEYPEEQKRFDYYRNQLEDIITSINQMQAIIEEIDVEMKQQFQQIVIDVNRILPQAFTKMFGGGTAELIFDQPDNLLETGIDIKVSPPGKKITNLNLLSGGEKSLVALSVLFSLLQVHPLPLVILDEAEAPLDAANVERFAKYIREFTQTTQFLVVTHREGTMINCEVLFGVTMQTPGITKMVKIRLNEDSKPSQSLESS